VTDICAAADCPRQREPYIEPVPFGVVQLALFKYSEVFYNRTRRHSALGYLSPDAYEAANAAA